MESKGDSFNGSSSTTLGNINFNAKQTIDLFNRKIIMNGHYLLS